jgi:hypothetical protein
MMAMPVTQPEPQFGPGHLVPTRPALYEVAPPSPAALEAAEVNRWLRLLAIPFVLASACFIALLATGQHWLIGGALATGPGLLITAFVYLGLSSDTNGES